MVVPLVVVTAVSCILNCDELNPALNISKLFPFRTYRGSADGTVRVTNIPPTREFDAVSVIVPLEYEKAVMGEPPLEEVTVVSATSNCDELRPADRTLRVGADAPTKG
jgi:hypothetical protein